MTKQLQDGKLRCPHCGERGESTVYNSRPVPRKNAIRRGRRCLECHKKYATYESPEAETAKMREAARNVIEAVRGKTTLRDLGDALRALRTALEK